MARYIGPRHRICRRIGKPLCGLTDCPVLKRNYPPGQHGRLKKRAASEFGRRLQEKQKLKFIYGISEKQLKNFYKKAEKKKGATGENLLIMLESRLDNVVYRLRLAPTRPAARQLVSHKHIQVNNLTVNIPSYLLKPKDKVRVSPQSKKFKAIQEAIKDIDENNLAPYLVLNKANLEGEITYSPKRSEILEDIDERLIVEYYAR